MAPDTANRFVRHSFQLLAHGWDSQTGQLNPFPPCSENIVKIPSWLARDILGLPRDNLAAPWHHP
jgi:hypothetical protein